MTVTWRGFRDEDLGLLAELNHQLFEDEGYDRGVDGYDVHGPPPVLAQHLERFLAQDHRAALCLDDGEVVGYALWYPDGHGIYLRQFFVTRERRGDGRGTAYLQAAREQLWPGQVITLEVLSGNHRGAHFWAKNGFTEVSRILRLG